MAREIPEDVKKDYLDTLQKIMSINFGHIQDFPRNDFMIAHLLVATREAVRQFAENGEEETENEMWLHVAAIAVRLYHESQEEDIPELVELIETTGVRAERKIKEHFTYLISQSRKEEEKVKKLSDYLGYNPYTEDEIQDMKRATDQKMK